MQPTEKWSAFDFRGLEPPAEPTDRLIGQICEPAFAERVRLRAGDEYGRAALAEVLCFQQDKFAAPAKRVIAHADQGGVAPTGESIRASDVTP